tara:strand:- start:392 stop:592 length:201 start_codon:yes stop_codon:yes gene_type:complete
MEIRPGAVPLASLAIVFTVLQIWWIGTTIRNGRAAEEAVSNRRSAKLLQKKSLKEKKQELENLLKK